MHALARPVAVLVLVLAMRVTGPAVAAPRHPPPAPPRLAVLIVIDQFRPDFITRFRHHFSDNGFNCLLRSGAFFPAAEFTYGAASTAPGHATIATGAQPRDHGIVANKWFRHPAALHADDAVVDPACELVPRPDRPAHGLSPRMMRIPALGDQLKLCDSRNRVFAVGLKDRSAIFLGGLRPDAAWWGDPNSGRFVTSTWYAAELPDWLNRFNAEKLPQTFAARGWDRLLPIDAYAGTRPVDPGWLPGYFGLGATFPHALPAPRDDNHAWVQALWTSPWGNELVIDLALRLIDAEDLGRTRATASSSATPITQRATASSSATTIGIDLLCIGLSSNDYCGHAFGPDSPEVMDITLRTDRQLGRLFDAIDQRVGFANCLIAVTADHGVTTSPFVAQELGLGGGMLDMDALCGTLNARLARYASLAVMEKQKRLIRVDSDFDTHAARKKAAEHAVPDDVAREPGRSNDAEQCNPVSRDHDPDGTSPRLVLGSVLPWVYLNDAVLNDLSPEDRAALLHDAAEFFRHTEGIAQAFTALDIAFPAGGAPAPRAAPGRSTDDRAETSRAFAAGADNPALQRARACYVPGRSGQIHLVVEPFWLPKERKVASHIGSSRHDRRVPVLLSGPGVRPGCYYAPADPADIAVTLAALLGIEPPLASFGRVLHEAIDAVAQP